MTGRLQTSLNKLENVLFLEFDLEPFQQRQIFVLKRPPFVMSFLVLDVANDHIQLRVPVRERAITFLPRKLPTRESSAVNPV
jgi:hypothetical protein